MNWPTAVAISVSAMSAALMIAAIFGGKKDKSDREDA